MVDYSPDKMRGQSSDGFIHIADWYPTFCKLAGVDGSDSGKGKFPVDGLDVWPIITGENTSTPHEEIVLGYEYGGSGAIIAGNYKLISGKQQSTMWDPLHFPCVNGKEGGNCDPYCLYDIVKDPYEYTDLSKSETTILSEMLKHYKKYGEEPRDQQDQGYHSDSELPLDNSACAYMKDSGGYWQPWE